MLNIINLLIWCWHTSTCICSLELTIRTGFFLNSFIVQWHEWISNVNTNMFFLWAQSYLSKNKSTVIPTKSSPRLTSSNCSHFWLIAYRYLLYLEDVFYKSVDIPICYNCAPFLVDMFLYSFFEVHFMQGFLKKNKKSRDRCPVTFLIKGCCYQGSSQ